MDENVGIFNSLYQSYSTSQTERDESDSLNLTKNNDLLSVLVHHPFSLKQEIRLTA